MSMSAAAQSGAEAASPGNTTYLRKPSMGRSDALNKWTWESATILGGGLADAASRTQAVAARLDRISPRRSSRMRSRRISLLPLILPSAECASLCCGPHPSRSGSLRSADRLIYKFRDRNEAPPFVEDARRTAIVAERAVAA